MHWGRVVNLIHNSSWQKALLVTSRLIGNSILPLCLQMDISGGVTNFRRTILSFEVNTLTEW